MSIVGVDEVGRGPLAGPVVAAAAAFSNEAIPEEVTDSKKLSLKKREYLYEKIRDSAPQWAIVSLGPRTIDEINIREAAKLAMSIAVSLCDGEQVLVDGNMPIDTDTAQETIIKGDLLRREIGAASILAKVWRDRRMVEYDKLFAGYGLASHAGYPTKAHKEAIGTLGVTELHRYSFKGVKEHVSMGDCRAALGVTVEEFRIITPDEDTILTYSAPDYWRERRERGLNVRSEAASA